MDFGVYLSFKAYTMAMRNCLSSPISENPRGFSVWYVLAKLSANRRNYSYPSTLCVIKKTKMNTFNLTLFIIFSMFISLTAFGQNAIDNLLSEKETKEDFQVLKKSILNYHPDIYLYTPKTELDSILADIEAKLGEMTIMEFYRAIYPSVSAIRNKHTNLSLPTSVKKYLGNKAKRIPFSLLCKNDSLYVLQDASKEYLVKEGSIITKINEIESRELLEHMMRYQSSDGFNNSLPLWNISRNFTTNYAVVYGTPDAFEIEYIDKDGVLKEVKIEAIPRSEFSKNKNFNIHIEKPNYEFRLLDTIGILAVKTFQMEDEKPFRTFLQNVFRQLNEFKINKLIVDVRGNTGGYPEHSDELLSYLIDTRIYPYKKQYALIEKLPKAAFFLENDVLDYFHNERFNKINDTLFVKDATNHVINPKRNNYSGKLVFLIDENCVSTTASMLGQVKEHLQTEFIGIETGGNPVTVVANYTVTQKLPNSGIEFKLPLIKSEKNVSFVNNGRGIMPSIKIEPTANDILENNDVILKAAIELMKE